MVSINQILNILKENEIYPDNISNDPDIPAHNLPAIGEVGSNERAIPISIEDFFDDDYSLPNPLADNPVFREWVDKIKTITESKNSQNTERVIKKLPGKKLTTQICAWYCPIHYFGKDWGIYIKQSCVLNTALDLATHIDTRTLTLSSTELCTQLYKASFFILYLHEHFHHKVESFGFRLLISSCKDKYRKYKHNVYRHTYGTSECLEESMANADIYNRLDEKKYSNSLKPEIRQGVRKYLKEELFLMQPPGYREAVHYLNKEDYQEGLFSLKSQILEGVAKPKMSSNNWLIANNMIRALNNIDAKIYTIVPNGTNPLFSYHISPSVPTQTRNLIRALMKYYDYLQAKKRGKGSHIMLIRDGFKTLTIPTSNERLKDYIKEQACQAIGGYTKDRFSDLLSGKLEIRHKLL